MTLDRKTPPLPIPIEDFDFREPFQFSLDNGIKVFALGGNEEEIVRTDIVFNAGTLKSENPLIACAAVDLLLTASTGKTAEEIASEFDFYGAFNSKSPNYRDSVLTNYTLAKHTESVYGLLNKYLQDTIFSQDELDTYRFTKIQSLTIAKERTSYLARKEFSKTVFGSHQYGFLAGEEDYNNLTVGQLDSFYKGNRAISAIYLSGFYNDEIIKNLNRTFGSNNWTPGDVYYPETSMFSGASEKYSAVHKSDALQCTVKTGLLTVTRRHPDFQKLNIVTTLLGGFFGSRLMKNIREEKGYTYGIHAGLSSYYDTSLFYIQTDVKKEVYNQTLDEIFKEINRLKNEPASADEIEILRNYCLGSFLRSMDGPFSLIERYKMLRDFGLTYNYYRDYLRLLKTFDSNTIMETARQYLKNEEMYQVVAGV